MVFEALSWLPWSCLRSAWSLATRETKGSTRSPMRIFRTLKPSQRALSLSSGYYALGSDSK